MFSNNISIINPVFARSTEPYGTMLDKEISN
jgi:hypothetical protein